MNAEVFYELAFGPHPWWDEKRGPRPELWVLWRTLRAPVGIDSRQDAVAVFNLDSDARMFMDFIIAAGLEEQLVRPPWEYVKQVKRVAEAQR